MAIRMQFDAGSKQQLMKAAVSNTSSAFGGL